MNSYKKEKLIKIGALLGVTALYAGLWIGAGYIGNLPSKNPCRGVTIGTETQKYGSLTFVKCGEEKIDRIIKEGQNVFVNEKWGVGSRVMRITPELNEIGLEAFSLQDKTIKTLDKIVEEKRNVE